MRSPRMTCSEFAAGRYHDDPRTEEREEEIEEEEEEEAPPLVHQVYMLSNISDRPPEVPLVCVAERPNIRALMASAVHSRRIWKISDPVVGVSFHPLSYNVQLFVGWSDEPTTPREMVRFPSF